MHKIGPLAGRIADGERVHHTAVIVHFLSAGNHTVCPGAAGCFAQHLQAVIVHPVIGIADHQIFPARVFQYAVFVGHNAAVFPCHKADLHFGVIRDQPADHGKRIIGRAIIAV